MRRKIFSQAAIVAALILSASGASAGEMDLVLKGVLRSAVHPAAPAASKALSGRGGSELVPCLIRSDDPQATADAIVDAGGRAAVVAGGIVSAHVPPRALPAIAERREVVFAEGAPPLASKMDTARAATRVDVVQDGSALGTAYRGRNVVVGVVDDGLDYGHLDFRGGDGYARVQYLRQTVGNDVRECTKRTIADGSCAIENGGQGTYHGTHVTGIAAGADSLFTGVAPEADIMFAFIDPGDGDSGGAFATVLLEGVTKIFEKADAVDKAAVVNLSVGTSLGAHDGTSLLEEGLTALSSAKGGRIIVNAAGNEQTVPGDFEAGVRDFVGGIHASIAAAAGAGSGYRLAVWEGAGAVSAFTGGTFVDVWLDAGQKDSCSIAAFAYTGGRAAKDLTFPGALQTADAAFATGDVPFAADTAAPVTATGSGVTATVEVAAADARNGKPHATVLFAPSSGSGSALGGAWFDVVVRSTGALACSGHMWLYFDVVAYHDFLKGVAGTAIAGGGGGAAYTLSDGDGLFTTTIPATATGVIAAGSFMPPKPAGAATSTWTADNGTTYDQSNAAAPGGTGSTTNDLSVFSSLGPTADGRTKPDVVAPGEPIVSTKAQDAGISSSLTVGGAHFKAAGTSMASPHVAGVVALLLERNNTLSVDAVRTALAAGAGTGGMTSRTADPANSYGAGKVDAASVLSSVSPDTSAYRGTGDLESPDEGCSLIAAGSPPSLASLWLIAIPAAALCCLRARKRS